MASFIDFTIFTHYDTVHPTRICQSGLIIAEPTISTVGDIRHFLCLLGVEMPNPICTRYVGVFSDHTLTIERQGLVLISLRGACHTEAGNDVNEALCFFENHSDSVSRG